jgi:hypothetical protein
MIHCRKEDDREWIILKYTASAYAERVMKCTGNCWIIGEQGNRERITERVNSVLVLYCKVRGL